VAAKLISFVLEAGTENVSDAKSLADLEDNVHPTTMESMEMYCKRVHRKNKEKIHSERSMDT
jgi:hypothetical protein